MNIDDFGLYYDAADRQWSVYKKDSTDLPSELTGSYPSKAAAQETLAAYVEQANAEAAKWEYKVLRDAKVKPVPPGDVNYGNWIRGQNTGTSFMLGALAVAYSKSGTCKVVTMDGSEVPAELQGVYTSRYTCERAIKSWHDANQTRKEQQ